MEQLLRVWENFTPPPGNSTIIFCPGAVNWTKKNAWVAGISSLKKIFPGEDVPSWNWLRDYDLHGDQALGPRRVINCKRANQSVWMTSETQL